MSYEHEMVIVGDDQLGHQITKEGKSFDLGNIFRPSSGMLGGDRFYKVYFRTESKNIYLFNEAAELCNANESRRRRELFKIKLNGKELQQMSLTIREPFLYKGGITTRIVEIIPHVQRSDSRIRRTAKVRRSTIVEDFKALANI